LQKVVANLSVTSCDHSRKIVSKATKVENKMANC